MMRKDGMGGGRKAFYWLVFILESARRLNGGVSRARHTRPPGCRPVAITLHADRRPVPHMHPTLSRRAALGSHLLRAVARAERTPHRLLDGRLLLGRRRIGRRLVVRLDEVNRLRLLGVDIDRRVAQLRVLLG